MGAMKGIALAASQLSDLTPSSLLLLGAAFSAVFYGLYLWLLPKPIPGIPYYKESARRILGDIPHMQALRNAGDTPRKFWIRMGTELGSPVTQMFLGPFAKPLVVLSDFREAQDLQVRNPKALARGKFNRELWKGLVPEHFIGMEEHDERFKDTKNLAKDLMTPSFLHQVNAPASHVNVEKFIALWQQKMQMAQGHPFDAFRDLGFLTFDIILAAALGLGATNTTSTEQLNRLRSEEGKLTPPSDQDELFPFPEMEKPELLQIMDKITEALAHAGTSPSPWLYHQINNLSPSMRKSTAARKTILQRFINQSSQRLDKEGEDFQPHGAIDYMISREATMAKKAGRKPVFDTPRIQEALLGYVVGGQDSTHSTLSFLVKHLGEEQEIQDKLRQALFQAYPDARANGQHPKLDDLLKVKVHYLDAFIEEVLRVSNGNMAVSKETAEDLTILGHFIPAGTALMFTSAGPTFTSAGTRVDESLRSESSQKHHDEGLTDWADSEFPPEEFHPERWLRPSEEDDGKLVFDPKAGPLLTFSCGPRICWGKRLAYMQLRMVVTLLLWNFVFEKLPADLQDWDLQDDLFIKPKHSRVKLSAVPAPNKVQ